MTSPRTCGANLGVSVSGELVGEDDIGGKDELDALGGGLLLEFLGQFDLVRLHQRAAGQSVTRSNIIPNNSIIYRQ